jgi:hypothetical protein
LLLFTGLDPQCLPRCTVRTFNYEMRRSEVSYGEVLGDKSTTHIRVTLYWGYLIYCVYFIWCVSCNVAVLTCFVMCAWLYVGVFWQLCGCFGNTYVYLYLLRFALFALCFCIVILICFVDTSVRTTATDWKLNCS